MSELNKREYIALELLKSKTITISDAYKMADRFIDEGFASAKDNEVRESIHPVFLRPIRDLEFNVRTTNILTNEGLVTIGDLVKRTEYELKRVPNLGKGTLLEISEVLASKDLQLGMTDADIAK